MCAQTGAACMVNIGRIESCKPLDWRPMHTYVYCSCCCVYGQLLYIGKQWIMMIRYCQQRLSIESCKPASNRLQAVNWQRMVWYACMLQRCINEHPNSTLKFAKRPFETSETFKIHIQSVPYLHTRLTLKRLSISDITASTNKSGFILLKFILKSIILDGSMPTLLTHRRYRQDHPDAVKVS